MAETSSTTVCDSKLYLNSGACCTSKFFFPPSNKLWSMERLRWGIVVRLEMGALEMGVASLKMPDDDLLSCVVACITEDVDITGVL